MNLWATPLSANRGPPAGELMLATHPGAGETDGVLRRARANRIPVSIAELAARSSGHEKALREIAFEMQKLTASQKS